MGCRGKREEVQENEGESVPLIGCNSGFVSGGGEGGEGSTILFCKALVKAVGGAVRSTVWRYPVPYDDYSFERASQVTPGLFCSRTNGMVVYPRMGWWREARRTWGPPLPSPLPLPFPFAPVCKPS